MKSVDLESDSYNLSYFKKAIIDSIIGFFATYLFKYTIEQIVPYFGIYLSENYYNVIFLCMVILIIFVIYRKYRSPYGKQVSFMELDASENIGMEIYKYNFPRVVTIFVESEYPVDIFVVSVDYTQGYSNPTYGHIYKFRICRYVIPQTDFKIVLRLSNLDTRPDHVKTKIYGYSKRKSKIIYLVRCWYSYLKCKLKEWKGKK